LLQIGVNPLILNRLYQLAATIFVPLLGIILRPQVYCEAHCRNECKTFVYDSFYSLLQSLAAGVGQANFTSTSRYTCAFTLGSVLASKVSRESEGQQAHAWWNYWNKHLKTNDKRLRRV